MSNYYPISKFLIGDVKLEGHSLERIQLNTDIISAHVMILVLTSEVFSIAYVMLQILP